MRTQLIHADGQKTFAVILEDGDEITASLAGFARAEGLAAASVTAIGAFEQAKLAFFDWATKAYVEIPVQEQVEVVSLLGDIGQDEQGKPALHFHALLSRRDGSTVGGHLLAGTVRPTLEAIVTESPAHLHRVHDPESGLALIRPR